MWLRLPYCLMRRADRQFYIKPLARSRVMVASLTASAVSLLAAVAQRRNRPARSLLESPCHTWERGTIMWLVLSSPRSFSPFPFWYLYVPIELVSSSPVDPGAYREAQWRTVET